MSETNRAGLPPGTDGEVQSGQKSAGETVLVVLSSPDRSCYHTEECSSVKRSDGMREVPMSFVEKRDLPICSRCAGELESAEQDHSLYHAAKALGERRDEEDRQKRLIPDGGESEAARLAEDAVRDLERSTETVERARGYAERAELEHPINRSPRAVAAASVYLAAMMNGEKATQAAVSGAVGVNPQTLRDALGEISEAEEEFQVGTGSGKSHEEPAEPAGMVDAIRGWFA